MWTGAASNSLPGTTLRTTLGRASAATSSDRLRAESILRSNRGFAHEDLDQWIDFAINADFKPMAAVPVTACPDCHEQPLRSLGRYISHSTLIRLHECACGLLWADSRL